MVVETHHTYIIMTNSIPYISDHINGEAFVRSDVKTIRTTTKYTLSNSLMLPCVRNNKPTMWIDSCQKCRQLYVDMSLIESGIWIVVLFACCLVQYRQCIHWPQPLWPRSVWHSSRLQRVSHSFIYFIEWQISLSQRLSNTGFCIGIWEKAG